MTERDKFNKNWMCSKKECKNCKLKIHKTLCGLCDVRNSYYKTHLETRLQESEEKMSKVRGIVDEKIKEIDEDKRFHYPPASVQINAPLALIQLGMESRMGLLKDLKKTIGEKE